MIYNSVHMENIADHVGIRNPSPEPPHPAILLRTDIQLYTVHKMKLSSGKLQFLEMKNTFPAWRNVKYQHGTKCSATFRGLLDYQNSNFPYFYVLCSHAR
jgi:hypothetical protein